MMKNVFLLLFILFCGQLITAQTISINPNTTYQTIEGFGASDAWTVDFVGQYFSDTEKEKAAQWLFSSQLKSDGSANGIGLSMWRFYLGAGTLGQGNASNINDMTRRGDAFLLPDGTYDYDNHHVGQKWFLKKAYDYGCDNFVAFSISPMVNFSKNGKGFCSYGSDGTSNLRPEKVREHANYLVNSLAYLEEFVGTPIRYISPLNEPQWDWQADANGNCGQEGSTWTNSEIRTFCIELDASLRAKGLSTKIFLGEAGAWNYLFAGGSSKGEQITDFFSLYSNNYIGNLPTLDRSFTGHSYWSDQNSSVLTSNRQSAKQIADEYGLKLHQTEWCMLTGLPADAPFSTGFVASTAYIDIALFMARVIYSDLTIANVSSWSYWTSMDREGGQFDRYLLLTLNPTAGNDLRFGGTITAAKTLWTLGNYSLFIRPGYKRCSMTGATDLTGLMGSAYIAPDTSKLVVVYVNLSNTTQQVAPQLKDIQGYEYSTIDIYQTNQTLNLQKRPSVNYVSGESLLIYGRSVMTFVYHLAPSGQGTKMDDVTKNKFECYPNPATDYLTCNASEPIQRITVTDLNGKVVSDIVLSGATDTYLLPVESLQAGMYLVSIRSRNDSNIFHIVKN